MGVWFRESAWRGPLTDENLSSLLKFAALVNSMFLGAMSPPKEILEDK